jgi:hypothetical protein
MSIKALLGAVLLIAGTQGAWADASAQGCASSDGRAAGCVASVPEIDASVGANAIALLSGALALMAERRRRTRK